ncbi:MAG: serine phosphatase RsbU (regulator of sigma subunit) [Flammeovirgaceae bacterium]|jgi:serine phosphatase RsbU (regulator of sigma subunit)
MAQLFKKSRITFQLLFWFLVISLPAEILITYVSYRNAEQSLKTEVTNSLNAIATRQANQIYKYLSSQIRTVETLSNLPDIILATENLASGLKDGGLAGTAFWEEEAKFRDLLTYYQNSFLYEDLILISKEGDIVFSVSNYRLLGKNMNSRRLWKTEIARLFDKVDTELISVISDFSMPPGTKRHSAFIGTPIQKSGVTIGVIMAQLDNAEINNVMNDYVGLGETGESLLAFRKADSVTFITNTRHEPNAAFNTSFSISDEKATAIVKATNRERGNGITSDYRGHSVLAVWSYIPSSRSGLVVKIDEAEAFAPIEELRIILIAIVLGTLLAIIIVAITVARSISKPIRKLTFVAKSIAAGNLEQKVDIKQSNEIGTLADSFNQMTDELKISQEKLQEYSKSLEQKVEERTSELENKNAFITSQADELQKEKDIIEKKNAKIIASIQYAKRMQTAMLPNIEDIQAKLPHSFILFKPKDIVSGDFYWFSHRRGKTLIAAVDCTGHGVPGAFMSVVGDGLLNQIVNIDRITTPSLILDQLHQEVMRAFRKESNNNRDGMDLAICMIDHTNHELQYAGARNPLIYLQNGELQVIKGDRFSIGGSKYTDDDAFTNHTINFKDIGTSFYIFSDGYVDQFGGSQDRKFMLRHFKELLLEVTNYPIEDQREILEETLSAWKGKERQTDDVLVVGFKLGS